MLAMLKRHAITIGVVVAVLYFRNEILGAMPMAVKKFFKAA
jgi:hypothetical protein